MTPLVGPYLSGLVNSGLLAQGGDSFWMPPRASSVAPAVDFVFNYIMAICAFFFALIMVLLVVFLIVYRRRPGVEPGPAPSHSTPLEIFWSVIPLGLVVSIFYFGFTTYMEMKNPPRNSLEIGVVAQKWSWAFQYADGTVTDKLHVPVDRPVRLTMQSRDVIHSLFVPAFRVKMDVVPGRYTQAWFKAVTPGEWDLYCAEYCGAGHSDMLSKVVVHKPGEFERWLEESAKAAGSMSPAQRGEKLFRTRGCGACHSTDGTPKTGGGPSLKGVFGHAVKVSKGDPVESADENYLRESIVEPNARLVEGFGPIMPTFKGQLKDSEISDLIEYIKTLK
jgi:cytochrome c oxidase subunit 2